MNLSDNEKHIKDLLGDATEDLDMDLLWDAVEPRLDKKKKKRILICWFLGIGFLLSTIGMTFNHVIESQKISSSEDVSEFDSYHNKNNTIHNNISIIQQDNNDKGIDIEDDQKAINNIVPEKGKIISSNNLTHSNTTSKNKYNINFYNLDDNKSKNTLTNNTIINNGTNGVIASIKNEWNPHPELNDKVSDSIIKDEIINEVEKEKEKEIDKKKKNIKPKQKKKSKKKKKWRKKWNPYFYSSASIAYPVRRLTSDGSVLGNDLLRIKNQHENSLEAYQFSANLKFIQKRNGLILNLGINYENINERLKYNEETTEIEMQSTVTSVLIGEDGSTLSVQEEMIEVTTITEREISLYNSYRFINMPIGIGYHAEFKKFNIEYEGGLDINLFFKSKGSTFNEDLQVIPLSRNMKKNVVKPSLWTSITLEYPINNNISLTGSSYIKYQPSSISKKEYELNQHFLNIGINIGAKFSIQ